MYWFAGTGAVQKLRTGKLPVLSKTLKKSMVTMGLALILYLNIKQFTNLWHFWKSIYECAESVIQRCSREKVQSWTKHIETFQNLYKKHYKSFRKRL